MESKTIKNKNYSRARFLSFTHVYEHTAIIINTTVSVCVCVVCACVCVSIRYREKQYTLTLQGLATSTSQCPGKTDETIINHQNANLIPWPEEPPVRLCWIWPECTSAWVQGGRGGEVRGGPFCNPRVMGVRLAAGIYETKTSIYSRTRGGGSMLVFWVGFFFFFF